MSGCADRNRSDPGTTSAGMVGDILCARMVRRAVAGLVTDGASLPGLYPMNEETRARYEKSKGR